MNKAMRRTFIIDNDVIPSRQPRYRITGREWPATVPTQEIRRALARSRRIYEAQALVWALGAAWPSTIFDHAETWERDGKVVMVTAHVYEGPTQEATARAWADANGVDFTSCGTEASWHHTDAEHPERGTTLFVFKRRAR